MLTLAAISIDRYYAICYPLRFKSSLNQAKRVICIIWLLSLSIMVPDLVYLAATRSQELSEAGLDTILYSDCNYTWSDQASRLFQYVKTILLYFLPFVFMFVAHFRIMRTLRISAQNEFKFQHSTRADNSSTIRGKATSNQSQSFELADHSLPGPDGEAAIVGSSRFGAQTGSRRKWPLSGKRVSTPSSTPASQRNQSMGESSESNQTDHNVQFNEPSNPISNQPLPADVSGSHEEQGQLRPPAMGGNYTRDNPLEQLQPCATRTSIIEEEPEVTPDSKLLSPMQQQQQPITEPSRRRSWFASSTGSFVGAHRQRNSSVVGLSQAEAAKSARSSSVCVAMHSKSQLESRRNAAKMLMAIVLFFGFCNLPVHLMNFLRLVLIDLSARL